MSGEPEIKSHSRLMGGARDMFRRIEFGDLILLLYLAALVRQYMWWSVAPDPLAWSLAFLAGALVWYFYVATKELLPPERTPLPFWLIVALPLCFVYAMRVVFPDVSFDVLNYRIFHAERAMSGFLYAPGDFFPTPAPYNPLPDMVTGISRYVLGYRLGTVVNLLAMFWTGSILDKLLRPYLKNAWLRSCGVLLVVLAEHMLFEINNYMADLLALPLMLEATRLALRNGEAEKPARHLARIAFVLGLSVTFKLTNLPVALPVALVCAYDFVIKRRLAAKELLKAVLVSLVAFIAPLLPFSLYLQQQTGSPVFPILNGIFKSPYWPANSGWDERWGAVGFWETLLWPLRITSSPERLSELALYSGRLSIGFVVALLALFVARRDRRLRTLCFITLAGMILWSATTGYIRYALYLELLAGVVVLALAAVVVADKALRLPSLLRTGLASLLWLALVVQAAVACRYVSETEWSGRPTWLTRPDAWQAESQHLLHDYSLRDFLTAGDRELFDGVEVWIESSVKTNGMALMLNHKAPMIGLRNHESFASPESRARFAAALEGASGKKMFSLSFAEDLPTALEFIKSRGLEAGRQTPLMVPFYSPQNRISVVLVEVTVAEQTARAGRGDGSPNNSVSTFQIQ